ncbi:bacteriorhodopsin [Spirosoma pomorum]
MENMENQFNYSSVQFDIVNHVLVLGAGAMLSGLVYFILTIKDSSPKYRLTAVISSVVMVSAALILFNQQQSWQHAFTWDGNQWKPGNATFSNGFRYVNWSIDVPMLLTQLIIVLGVSRASFRRRWIGLVIAGLLMIYTGYVGQFYEANDTSKLLIWGAISTVFMVYICYIVGISVAETHVGMPPKAASQAKAIFWLMIVAWTLYPIAYLMPWLSPTPNGMVARQILYTIADITSKVIFGVMLSQLATRLSADEGYEPAKESMKSVVYGRG